MLMLGAAVHRDAIRQELEDHLSQCREEMAKSRELDAEMERRIREMERDLEREKESNASWKRQEQQYQDVRVRCVMLPCG